MSREDVIKLVKSMPKDMEFYVVKNSNKYADVFMKYISITSDSYIENDDSQEL